MKYDIKLLKQYKITDYLNALGCEPIEQNEKRTLYISPFRDEKSPSFWVDTESNTYKDFGDEQKGGDIIDLVQRVEKINRYKAFERVYNFVQNFEGFEILNKAVYVEKPKRKMAVLSAKPLESKQLLQYCNSRAISTRVAKGFLYQVAYLNPNDQRFLAVGVVNVRGGYEIRSSYGKNSFKACIGEKAYTKFSRRPKSNTLYLFEGMFDFLAAMELKNWYGIEYLEADCIILNSLSCFVQVSFEEYQVVRLFLDNDEAGEKATKKIISTYASSDIWFQDMAKIYYPNHKDLNEFLLCLQSRKK